MTATALSCKFEHFIDSGNLRSAWDAFFTVFGSPAIFGALFQSIMDAKARRNLGARAVDAAYGRRVFRTDAERVAFLFDRFAQLSRLLPRSAKPTRRKASGASA